MNTIEELIADLRQGKMIIAQSLIRAEATILVIIVVL